MNDNLIYILPIIISLLLLLFILLVYINYIEFSYLIHIKSKNFNINKSNKNIVKEKQ
jgi:hypothetical protein